jgi:hypothetical protein
MSAAGLKVPHFLPSHNRAVLKSVGLLKSLARLDEVKYLALSIG